MRKITDIYKEYKIIPILQMHQLRVAAVAMQICESLDIEVETDIILKACLIHDMGNMVKLDSVHAKTIFKLSDEEVEASEKLRDEFIAKYGESDYEANEKIAREITNSERIINLIGGNRFSNMCLHKEGEDWASKIIHYADGRIGPGGVMSYDDRMEEANKRYQNHKLKVRFEESDRLKMVACGKEIEAQIFAHSSIKPEDINNESVLRYIEILKDYEI